MSDQSFELSHHASDVLERRGIRLEWVEKTLQEPIETHADPKDPDLQHALRPIEDFGERTLRVVYNPQCSPPLIVTAFFDRSRKGDV